MATHSSTLAWRIPLTEEPGGLQSMGLQELDTTQWLNHIFSSFSSYLGSLSDSLCFSSPALRYYFSKEPSSVIFVFCYNEDHYKYYFSIPDPSFLMSQPRIFSAFQNIVSSFLQHNLFSYKWCFFSTAFPGHPWTIGSEAPMDTKIHRCSSLFCKIKQYLHITYTNPPVYFKSCLG